VFETVIRHIGAFLSVYELTNDDLFLGRARQVGDSLMPFSRT